MGRSISLAVVLLAVSLSTLSRADEILFSESFENCPAQIPVIARFGGWEPLCNSIGDPGENIFTDRQSSDGTISLQQYGSHRGCWAAGVYHQVFLPAEFLLDVDMMASGEVDNTYTNVCAGNRNDIAVGLFSDFDSWGHGVWLATFNAGGVISGVPSVLMDNAVPMRWYRVRMKVNRVEGSVDYWINGVHLGNSFNPECRRWGPTLKYLCFQSGGGRGWIDNVRVHTDDTAPVTALALTGVAGEDGWFWSDVLVTLTATDNASGVARTEYSFDAGRTWRSYAGPFNVTREGRTTIRYRSVDNMGNVESFLCQEVKIDRIPPMVGGTNPVNWATNVPGDQTITVVFSEGVQPGTGPQKVKLYRGRTNPAREVATTTDVAGSVLSLDPVRHLAPKSVYRVVIPAGAVKDMAGHPLAEDYAPYSFKTSR